jgi:starch synthase
MIDVLAIASEIYPLVKTGGLADVTGALPGAMANLGISMRTLVPGYPQVLAALSGGRDVAEFTDLWGGPAKLVAGRAGNLNLIVIDAPHLYDRDGGPYVGLDGVDYPDNWMRFAALSWVGAELGRGLVDGYRPQVLHAHDWQAGLTPAYVVFGPPNRAKTVLTIHNLAFQGQYGWDLFPQLKLPPHAFSVEGVEYYGGVGYLKAGIQCADALTTVSPTYAGEIRTTDFGMGLDGLLNQRAEVLHGFLNGVDPEAWDPGEDPALARTYGAGTASNRATNKAALVKRFAIEDGDGPLFGVVSRLTWQKGMDMLVSVIEGIVGLGGRLVVVGSGDKDIEDGFRWAVQRFHGKVGFVRGYDEKLSRLIQGGADAILVPSRFEPCGLTQLIGLRYGCVPIVSHVGGLADTIIDANEAAIEAGVATGLHFYPTTSHALYEALRRATDLYRQPKVWKKIQRRGMKADVSWDHSAQKYADLYAKLTGRQRDDLQTD